MSALIRAALTWLQPTWRQILAIHFIYIGIGFIAFAPLLGVLGQILLKISGRTAVADMDLLFFALSPAGLLALGLFSAFSIVVVVFELASLMALGVAAANGQSIGVIDALKFSLRQLRPIFVLAAWLVIRLSLIAAPFALAAGAVAFFLITEYDINYYLAVQPSEFWVAALAIGLIAILMTAVLIRSLVHWSLSLPLVLFVGTPPAKSFGASSALTKNGENMILQTLVTWAVATLLIGAAIALSVRLMGDLFVPLSTGSVTLLALSFGFLAAIWLIATTLATALTAGSLAFLLAALAHQLEPQFRAVKLHASSPSGFTPVRFGYTLGFLAAVGMAAFIGYVLLDEITIADEAEIIAHRGASGSAPENTLASIRRAIADGADWVEVDVQETADGEVVVIHDSDLMKLANVDLRVWDANLEQLADIDIGSWFAPEFADQRVPTLAEVLDEVKGRSKLIVELKYYGHDQQLEQRVIDLIETAGMQNDIMIMSLEYAGIQKVRALRPDWPIGLLSARALGDLTRLDADFLAVNRAMARPALIKAAHGVGKKLYVWTINDALAISQMLSRGVDGIITDEPSLGREVLDTRARLSSVQRLLLHMSPLFGVEAASLNFESNDAEFDDKNINLELNLQQRFHDQIVLPDSALSEFTTDGCSGGLSVGWDYFARQVGKFGERHGMLPPWQNCCIEHDRAYHAGGGVGLTATESFLAREEADDELHTCVLATASERGPQLQSDYGLDEEQVADLYQNIAVSMHTAVRLGGMPCTGLSWRWGYGWPDCL